MRFSDLPTCSNPLCRSTLIDGECPMTCTYCNRHDCECDELRDDMFVPLDEEDQDDEA